MAEKTNYNQAVGRRKTAIARVRLTAASKHSILVNGRELADYFKTKELQNTALEAFKTAGIEGKYAVSAKIIGGGIAGQAIALRHAISRALLTVDRNLRSPLKKAGFLTRDQRSKERRKFGLKKARKAPQWSKR
ncbi:MAG: ribosomal protein small subunit ribosomal protein [Candidatus Parcubacteria bacterium]|jgi:small subunit ribosomal protein S9